MKKVAVVILAGKEGHESMARLKNALVAVNEFSEAKIDVKMIFDGAATAWFPEIMNEENYFYEAFKKVEKHMSGICEHCAGAFKSKKEIEKLGLKLDGKFNGHPSFAGLVKEGYQIITF